MEIKRLKKERISIRTEDGFRTFVTHIQHRKDWSKSQVIRVLLERAKILYDEHNFDIWDMKEFNELVKKF